MSEIEEVLKEWDELSNEYKNLEVRSNNIINPSKCCENC